LLLLLLLGRCVGLTPLRRDGFCFCTLLVTMNPFLRPTAMPDMMSCSVGSDDDTAVLSSLAWPFFRPCPLHFEQETDRIPQRLS
jgi:hypothetical protein